ncbi:unnamed protein product [Agarophyton chilense]|eukprot:gb/GEZJ01000665.1/.p1 GENE.gb/GEZJ01000665.1/~~gb/GEZJ01000665.1/.p1  ORF type:complete len:748 (-),score=72.91 gb/GEZJ01000665.1/:6017-8260(-)
MMSATAPSQFFGAWRKTKRFILLIATLVVFPLLLTHATLQGQSVANRLRHGVAVSGLPSQFGKKGSAVLSRLVIPRSQVWNPKNLHPFVEHMFRDPSRLDWLVADVISMEREPDLITINGGFSCLDRGKSSSYPLTWWVSENLTELTELKSGPGGAEIQSLNGTASSDDSRSSVHDITAQCLTRRMPDPSLRLVEHHGVHSGTGVVFKTFNKKASRFIGDVNVFSEILEKRSAEDRATPVVYHEKGIPIVFGLTFDTGFRIKVPDDFAAEKTLDLRVPMTPLAALTFHTVARMQEERVGEGVPNTSPWLLTMALLSAALPLLFALWIITNFISTTACKSALELQELSAVDAVIGKDHWLKENKGTIILHIVGAAILAAPLGLAITEHDIDPRVFVEMTQGITVFYGSSQENLSQDPQNLVAGAPFILTSWISIRELNPSYIAHFALICVLISFLAVIIVWRDVVKMNEIMPGHASSSYGISLQKLVGRLKLWLKSSKGERKMYYMALITFRQDFFESLQVDVTQNRHFSSTMMLLVNNQWRLRANDRDRDKEEANNAGGELYDTLMRGDFERSEFSIVCRMRLDNKTRFEATMARLKRWWEAKCPRAWEYIRRNLRGCAPLEQYHRRGQYPPDEALILVRLGLLDYLQYLDKVFIKASTGADGLYGDDETKCFLVFSPPSLGTPLEGSPPPTEDSTHEDLIEFITFNRWRDAPPVLRRWREGQMQIESVQINGQRFGYARVRTPNII